MFNFSHETPIADAKAQMGHRVALMGNVPPLDVGVRGTPDEVTASARACLAQGAPGDGMILSFGGGIAPGTRRKTSTRCSPPRAGQATGPLMALPRDSRVIHGPAG